MAKDIVLIGAGGHAKVVLEVLQLREFKVLGFIDAFKNPGEEYCGYEVLGNENLLTSGPLSRATGVISVGDNWTRHLLASKILATNPNFEFIAITHPQAQLSSNVVLGCGTVVMAGAVINPGARVGNFCIVNTCAAIDHDCALGNYSSLAPRATLGGGVKVGEFSAICIGAVVSHQLTIGKHTVVGAGSTVLTDLPPYCVAYGLPAREVRKRQSGEPYLSG